MLSHDSTKLYSYWKVFWYRSSKVIVNIRRKNSTLSVEIHDFLVYPLLVVCFNIRFSLATSFPIKIIPNSVSPTQTKLRLLIVLNMHIGNAFHVFFYCFLLHNNLMIFVSSFNQTHFLIWSWIYVLVVVLDLLKLWKRD